MVFVVEFDINIGRGGVPPPVCRGIIFSSTSLYFCGRPMVAPTGLYVVVLFVVYISFLREGLAPPVCHRIIFSSTSLHFRGRPMVAPTGLYVVVLFVVYIFSREEQAPPLPKFFVFQTGRRGRRPLQNLIVNPTTNQIFKPISLSWCAETNLICTNIDYWEPTLSAGGVPTKI